MVTLLYWIAVYSYSSILRYTGITTKKGTCSINTQMSIDHVIIWFLRIRSAVLCIYCESPPNPPSPIYTLNSVYAILLHQTWRDYSLHGVAHLNVVSRIAVNSISIQEVILGGKLKHWKQNTLVAVIELNWLNWNSTEPNPGSKTPSAPGEAVGGRSWRTSSL